MVRAIEDRETAWSSNSAIGSLGRVLIWTTGEPPPRLSLPKSPQFAIVPFASLLQASARQLAHHDVNLGGCIDGDGALALGLREPRSGAGWQKPGASLGPGVERLHRAGGRGEW